MRIFRPLRNPQFRRLVGGRLVSQLGDWLLVAALVGWVYGESGSTAAVASLMLMRLVPPIVGGGLAAAFVDRLAGRRLLVLLETARGLATLAALSGVILARRELVFAGVAAIGALASLSSVSVRALVPSLAPRELLPAANGCVGVAQELALVLGALGAGAALTAASVGTALWVALACSAVAAACYWPIRARERGSALPRDERSVRAGLRHLRTRGTVLAVVLAFGVSTLATGLANATLPRFLGDELGLGPGGYGFGLAALAVGLALGQAVTGCVRVDAIAARWAGWSLLAMSVLFAGLAVAPDAGLAIVLLALIGFADGTSEVVFDSVVQRECHQAYLGRIFGLASALMTTTMMGAVAAAPLLNAVAAPQSVLLVGCGCLLAAASVAIAGSTRVARIPEALPHAQ